jgi:hypothetical protein
MKNIFHKNQNEKIAPKSLLVQIGPSSCSMGQSVVQYGRLSGPYLGC